MHDDRNPTPRHGAGSGEPVLPWADPPAGGLEAFRRRVHRRRVRPVAAAGALALALGLAITLRPPSQPAGDASAIDWQASTLARLAAPPPVDRPAATGTAGTRLVAINVDRKVQTYVAYFDGG